MATYIPNTPEERKAMMEVVGIDSLDGLYDAVPEEMKIEKLALPAGMSEMDVARRVEEMAEDKSSFTLTFHVPGRYILMEYFARTFYLISPDQAEPAAMAAEYPPGPPPITSRSNCCITCLHS